VVAGINLPFELLSLDGVWLGDLDGTGEYNLAFGF
jgi:hypothetical protein